MRTKYGLWTKAVGIALAAAVLVVAVPVFAQSYDPQEELPKPTGFQKAVTKLGRGLSNILLGWAEIPMALHESIQNKRPFGHLVGVAPVTGAARAVMRTGTGVFEAVTFPLSDQEVNYEAVLEPEYIF